MNGLMHKLKSVRKGVMYLQGGVNAKPLAANPLRAAGVSGNIQSHIMHAALTLRYLEHLPDENILA